MNCANPQTINEIFYCFATGNMMGFIPVLILAGLITLLSGIIKFISAGDNEEQRTSGRQVMTYGIIVLFVMISFWGFVSIITHSFFTADQKIPNYLPNLMSN